MPDIQTFIICVFIHSFSDCLTSWVSSHKASLVLPGGDLFFFPYCESVWNMVYLVPGCCNHSCIFCASILSSMFSSLQLLIATESEQDQLLPESAVLYYLVSHVNHHDDVPWCFHPKLLLSFICLRHDLRVDFLFPVLMPVSYKNILIQHAVTIVLSDLHSLTTFSLEVINAKSWVE